MPEPRTTIWKLGDHSVVKHKILRGYLDWWLPTQLQVFERMGIIDGFCGPGEYSGGEPGSPLIAIASLLALNVSSQELRKITFTFVDRHEKRYYHLYSLLKKLYYEQWVDQSLNIRLEQRNFVQFLSLQLSVFEKKHIVMPPTFLFLDPFGFKDTPLSLLACFMLHPNNDILITFMYEEINRFLSHANKKVQQRFTDFLGTERWREIDLTRHREKQIVDLYLHQVRNIDQTVYSCSFCIKNKKNSTDYFLVFMTHQRSHMEKMKEVFWSIDTEKGESYSAFKRPLQQSELMHPNPYYIPLREELLRRFTGRTTLPELEEYVLTETNYCQIHAHHVLEELEQASQISIISPNEQRQPGRYIAEDIVSFF
jgi:three-Cys-motif partner protein